MKFTFVLPTIIKESTSVFIQYVRTYIIFSHMHSLLLPLCGAALRTWVTFCAIDRLNQQSYVRTYDPIPHPQKHFPLSISATATATAVVDISRHLVRGVAIRHN